MEYQLDPGRIRKMICRSRLLQAALSNSNDRHTSIAAINGLSPDFFSNPSGVSGNTASL
jgi:hypothetical protein